MRTVCQIHPVLYDIHCCTLIIFDAGVEILPFLPKTAKEQALTGTPASDPSQSSHIFIMTPSVPLMILPMCMYLARNLGGRGGGPARARGPARGSSKAGAGVGAGSDSLAMDGVMSSRSRSRRAVSMPKQKFSAMFWRSRDHGGRPIMFQKGSLPLMFGAEAWSRDQLFTWHTGWKCQLSTTINVGRSRWLK